ncbi:hypothetical protein GDO78_013980 [Eleutherodactylus coqui]|uniref:Uncharacterized protein n=1 Tax=Eleutherodactylus coqui TaxID=57060 RepID=A0A8J6EF58_ELECQ|nr:hypothetical protein GDO78_013980 [Eleutherodactylus coqui]
MYPEMVPDKSTARLAKNKPSQSSVHQKIKRLQDFECSDLEKKKISKKRVFIAEKWKKLKKCKNFGIVVAVPVRRKNGMSHLCCMINAVKKNFKDLWQN